MNKLMVVGLLSRSVYEVRYSVTNAKMKHLIKWELIIKEKRQSPIPTQTNFEKPYKKNFE